MRSFLVVLVIASLVGGGIFFLYVYQKNSIIESIEDDLMNILSSQKVVVTDVQIDPDKVHLNPMSVFPDWAVDVVAEDVKASIKSLSGEGVLKVGNIKMEYPLFRSGDLRFCSADDTSLVYGDEKIDLNFSLKDVTFEPCSALNGGLSPMSVSLRNIVVELKDGKEAGGMNVIDARADSLLYSIRGNWQSMPVVEDTDNLDSLVNKVNKWRLTANLDKNYRDLWVLNWEMANFSLDMVGPDEKANCSINRTSVMSRGFLDEKRKIWLELTYNLQDLVVDGWGIKEQLEQAGLSASDLWPLKSSFKASVSDLPSEVLAAGLILQREARKSEPDQMILGYVTMYLVGLMTQKQLPIYLEASFDLPGDTGGVANIDGSFSAGSFTGSGTLMFKGLDRIMPRLRGADRDKVELLVSENLKCDETLEICSGRLEISGGSVRVYPEKVGPGFKE